jgi:hypothetical protein
MELEETDAPVTGEPVEHDEPVDGEDAADVVRSD